MRVVNRGITAMLLLSITAGASFAQQRYSLSLQESQVPLRGELHFTLSPSPTAAVRVDIVGTGNNRNWQTGLPETPGPDGFTAAAGEPNQTKSAHSFTLGFYRAVAMDVNGNAISNPVSWEVIGNAPTPPTPTTPPCTMSINSPGALRVGQAAAFSVSQSAGCTISQIVWSSNGGTFAGNVLTPNVVGPISVAAGGKDQFNRNVTATGSFSVVATPPQPVTCTLIVTGPLNVNVQQPATFSAISPNCAGQISNLVMSVNGASQPGFTYYPPSPGFYSVTISADSPNGRISGSTGLTALATPPSPPTSCTLTIGYSGVLQVGQQISFTATPNGCTLDGPPTLVVTGSGTKTGPTTFIPSAPGQITANFTGYSGGQLVYGSLPLTITAATTCTINVGANPNPVEAGKAVSVSFTSTCGIADAQLSLYRPIPNSSLAYGPFAYGGASTITLPGLAADIYTAVVTGNNGQARGQTTLTVTAPPAPKPCLVNLIKPAVNPRIGERYVFKLSFSDGTKLQGGVIKFRSETSGRGFDVAVTAGQTEVAVTFLKAGNWSYSSVLETDCGRVTNEAISFGVANRDGVVPLPFCAVSIKLVRLTDGQTWTLLGYENEYPRGTVPDAALIDKDGKPIPYRILVDQPLGSPAPNFMSLVFLGRRWPAQLQNQTPNTTGNYGFDFDSFSFLQDGKMGPFVPEFVQAALRIEWAGRTGCVGGQLPPLMFYGVDGIASETRPRIAVQNAEIPAGVVVNTGDTNAFPHRGIVGENYFVARVNGNTVESNARLLYVTDPHGVGTQLKMDSEGRFAWTPKEAGHYVFDAYHEDGRILAEHYWVDE